MTDIDYDILGDALGRAGSNWTAAQAHGLVAGKLSVSGTDGASETLSQILEGCDENNALRGETAAMLSSLVEQTYKELSERLSAFSPLLPDDSESGDVRAEALGHWCEGFLHGLVSSGGSSGEQIRTRLAADPVADIIKDMLQITRASAEPGEDAETNEEAYAEIVEYLRVATQLIYEELADARHGSKE